jgi:tripartite-type tricarboxylate transporter receptor subunit TctC
MIARWLIQPLALQAGVTGQVVNRPGAAGALAADAVLAAAAESGTLLLGGLDPWRTRTSTANAARSIRSSTSCRSARSTVTRGSW